MSEGEWRGSGENPKYSPLPVSTPLLLQLPRIAQPRLVGQSRQHQLLADDRRLEALDEATGRRDDQGAPLPLGEAVAAEACENEGHRLARRPDQLAQQSIT